MIEAEEIQAKNEKEAKRLIGCYRRFANTKDGKIILEDLRRFCGQDRSSICFQSPDPYQTMGCEGKRSVFLYMNNKIESKETEDE